VAVVASAFGIRFYQLGQTEVLASIRSVQENEGIPVETVKTAPGSLEMWTTLAGTVEGTVQYAVVSNNALQIIGIDVREGDLVKKGDVIVRLASGAPSPMFHSLARAKANYQNALLNVQRLRNMYEAGAVAKSELDAAETTLKVLASDVQDAEGSTVLTATEAGTVSSILVDLGETASAGKALVWITDTREVKVKFSAGSNQALALEAGQPAVWTAPDGIGREGQISQLDLMANPQTHLLNGEVLFDNSDGTLVPGLLVSFRVRTQKRDNVLVLPKGCLVKDGNQDAVWVTNGHATLKPVQTGLKTDDEVEILVGLEAGQSVVRHGQTMLSEGVRIKNISAGKDQ
jgi:membrane fusion protein, multidrug efflux system